MEFLKIFSRTKEEFPVMPMVDTTLYKVDTRTKTYCGNISHQNDVVIWLRSSSAKSIKILKENITRITVVTR